MEDCNKGRFSRRVRLRRLTTFTGVYGREITVYYGPLTQDQRWNPLVLSITPFEKFISSQVLYEVSTFVLFVEGIRKSKSKKLVFEIEDAWVRMEERRVVLRKMKLQVGELKIRIEVGKDENTGDRRVMI